MEPGLQQIAEAAYHADPCPVASLSARIVDILTRESPLHAWYASPKLNPDYVEPVDSKFDIGTAAHALFFEGMDKAVIVEADDWRTKLARETRDAIRAAGKLPLLAKHHSAVQAMVEAALNAWEHNDDMKGYALADGKNEWSIICEDRGTWYRCKPDHLSSDMRLIVDAKFTDTSANPAAFERQIDRMGYDSRAAFYLRLAQNFIAARGTRYVFLVVETTPPHAASFVALDPAYIDLGQRKVERAIAIWRECMKSGKWPAYQNRIAWAAPPAWSIAQWEEQEMRNPFGEKP